MLHNKGVADNPLFTRSSPTAKCTILMTFFEFFIRLTAIETQSNLKNSNADTFFTLFEQRMLSESLSRGFLVSEIFLLAAGNILRIYRTF